MHPGGSHTLSAQGTAALGLGAYDGPNGNFCLSAPFRVVRHQIFEVVSNLLLKFNLPDFFANVCPWLGYPPSGYPPTLGYPRTRYVRRQGLQGEWSHGCGGMLEGWGAKRLRLKLQA